MRIEHKLQLEVAQYCQSALEQLRELRRRYLEALGQAKEVEMAMGTVRAALSQQLAIVEQVERLPKPLAPYVLSEDGARLVGELAAGEGPAKVNGSIQQSAVSGQPPAEKLIAES